MRDISKFFFKKFAYPVFFLLYYAIIRLAAACMHSMLCRQRAHRSTSSSIMTASPRDDDARLEGSRKQQYNLLIIRTLWICRKQVKTLLKRMFFHLFITH